MSPIIKKTPKIKAIPPPKRYQRRPKHKGGIAKGVMAAYHGQELPGTESKKSEQIKSTTYTVKQILKICVIIYLGLSFYLSRILIGILLENCPKSGLFFLFAELSVTSKRLFK